MLRAASYPAADDAGDFVVLGSGAPGGGLVHLGAQLAGRGGLQALNVDSEWTRTGLAHGADS